MHNITNAGSQINCCLDCITRFSEEEKEEEMLVAPLWKVPWRGLVSSGTSRRGLPLPTSFCRRGFNTDSAAYLGVRKFNGGRRPCGRDGHHGTQSHHLLIVMKSQFLLSFRCAPLGQDLGAHLFSPRCFGSGQRRDRVRGRQEGDLAAL